MLDSVKKLTTLRLPKWIILLSATTLLGLIAVLVLSFPQEAEPPQPITQPAKKLTSESPVKSQIGSTRFIADDRWVDKDTSMTTASPQKKPKAATEEPEPTIAIPFILQITNHARYARDPNVEKAIDLAQKHFVDSMRHAQVKNPSDPAYLALWEKARAEANTQLETFIGTDAVNQLVSEATVSAKQEQDAKRQ